MPVLGLPRSIIIADGLFVFWTQRRLGVRADALRNARRCSKCAGTCPKQHPARHCTLFHGSFLPTLGTSCGPSCGQMRFQLVKRARPALLMVAARFLVMQLRMNEGKFGAFGNGSKPHLDPRFAGVFHT